ncbi:hypothetical protein DFH07DRAFT_493948 [Mycena maculata]|uniref:Uncharacterized protein n=1 Tax=Mycena maculata TaxID=230809 RepID=A0AAD7ND88_9AGAR|nr:hypothetical protein DFH07DRAFT_493948 [Mycena maculata]
MSLNRILNDEPSLTPSSYDAPQPIHPYSTASSSRVSPPRFPPYSQKKYDPPPYPYPGSPNWAPSENRVPCGVSYDDERRRESQIEYAAPAHRRSPSYSSSDAPPTVVKAEPEDDPSLDDHEALSSDLEDCEEVWIEELSDYIFETQKRQNEVERSFEAGILAHNSIVARTLAHRYADLASLSVPTPSASPTPASPSPPPPPAPVEKPRPASAPPSDSDSDDEVSSVAAPMLFHDADFTTRRHVGTNTTVGSSHSTRFHNSGYHHYFPETKVPYDVNCVSPGISLSGTKRLRLSAQMFGIVGKLPHFSDPQASILLA